MEEKTGGLTPVREAQVRAWANGSFTPPLQFDRAYALELLAEIDRLRAQQCIPPDMTPGRLGWIANEIESHRLAEVVHAEVIRCLREWAKWLREHPAPSGEPTRADGDLNATDAGSGNIEK